MHLLIVMTNYNGSGLTIDCLRSLRPELDALPGAHVALCDNGSGQGEVERLEAAIDELGLADRVTLTAIHPNRGFTGGNNAVLRAAFEGADPPDAAFLLNNDTLVLPGSIQALVEYLNQHKDVAVCGSRLEYPDGESQRAARRTLTFASEFDSYARVGIFSRLLSRWIVTPPERSESHPCGWVPGAALMIRRRVFETIGWLDEDLYTYFDDVDFCLRAKRAGWPTWYVPQSRIVHLVGKTTGITGVRERPKRRPSYWFWARRHYFLKNFGRWHTALADTAAIAGLCCWKIRCVLKRSPDPDPPYLLSDIVRHSVWRTGFRIQPVVNPLAGETQTPASAKIDPPLIPTELSRYP